MTLQGSVKVQNKKMLIGYKSLELVFMSECVFVDNLKICTKNQKELQHNLDLWYMALEIRNFILLLWPQFKKHIKCQDILKVIL